MRTETAQQDRVKIGVPGLDAMLGGGLRRGDAVLVKGGAGEGKTAFGLQWVCRGAIDFDEPGAIIVLEETPHQLYRRASAFGWDLRQLEEQNKVRTIFTSAEALGHDILNSSLLVGMLGEIGARRVAIDPITHYRLVCQDGRQLRQQVCSTINALKRIGQTSLLLAEKGTAGWNEPAPEEYLADVVISLGRHLGASGGLRRLDILKSGGLDPSHRSALYRVTATGVQVVSHLSPEGLAAEVLRLGIGSLYQGVVGNRRAASLCVFEVEAKARRASLDLALATLPGFDSGEVIYFGSSCVNPSDLWGLAVASVIDRYLDGTGGRGLGAHLVEPFGRRCPGGFPASRFHHLDGYGESLPLLGGAEGAGNQAGLLLGKRLMVCDLSDMCFYLGLSKFQMLLPRLVDLAKTQGVSVVAVVDPRLMTRECLAWVEGAADGIVRIWEDDCGRLVQAIKGADETRSQPRLLVESDHPPFFELV